MYRIETVYTRWLAQNCYLLISDGEAVAFDPARDTSDLLAALAASGTTLKAIFETHSHADFVTGGPQLAHETGAPLYISEVVEPAVPHVPLRDGDEFRFGSAKVTAIHTPGHTPEHMAYYVEDIAGDQPPSLLSGDLIFVGDLGRPELLGDDLAKDLAPQLFDSVFERILPLPPQTTVYPGHGAGSLCGKQLREEPTSTLAQEFATSPALQLRDKQEFVRYMLADQPRVPTNFARLAKLNRAGAPLAAVFTAKEVDCGAIEEALRHERCAVLDIRSVEDFSERHIAGSYFLGLDSGMPTWLGWLFRPESEFYLIVERPEYAKEFASWMARIGYDNVSGYLVGLDEWVEKELPTRSLTTLPPSQASLQANLFDIRTPMEFAAGHLEGTKNLPLCELSLRLSEFPRDEQVTLMCGAGYRGAIAASILFRHGFGDIANIAGGYAAVEELLPPNPAGAASS